jgi:UDP-glucuronate decarboxylase
LKHDYDLRMANILITGAAGFLGSHLMLHHLKKGDHVLGLDNYSSSRRDSRHIKFLRELYSPERYSLCEVDITEYMDVLWEVDKFLAEHPGKFELIYNFACPASPPKYHEMPVETVLACTVGTANILQLAKQHESILVHASTSEVYGDPIVSPQPETYRGNVNSYGPRACYDEGKRAAEALCYDYLHKYGVDARVVRIFNTYGPHMDPEDGRAVSNFIMQALRCQPFTIYGQGKQTRSFCYVDDMIKAITAVGEMKSNPHTPINLGNPHEFTVRELAEIVSRLINRDSRANIRILSTPPDDPAQRQPDITLAQKYLNWEPRIHIEEGLMRTIDWFKGELG